MEDIRSEMYQNFKKTNIINRTEKNPRWIWYKTNENNNKNKWNKQSKKYFVFLVDLLYDLYLVTLHKI